MKTQLQVKRWHRSLHPHSIFKSERVMGNRIPEASRASFQLSREAFTMVELLVVFCVMAILWSLVLTGLRQAVDMGRRAKCVSQMKQLGQAVVMYANDCDGWLPMTCSRATDPPGFQQWHLNDALLRNLGITRTYTGGKWVAQHYDRLTCPSDKSPCVSSWYASSISYAANYNMGSGSIAPPYWCRIDQFSLPSEACWAFEARGSTYYSQMMASPDTVTGIQIPYLHSGGFNALFLDGRVSWLQGPVPYYDGANWHPSEEVGRKFWFGSK